MKTDKTKKQHPPDGSNRGYRRRVFRGGLRLAFRDRTPNNRRPWLAQRHDHDRRQAAAATAPEFGGVIKELATDSKTWWPPRVVPPKGAPNVLLIMTDDQGYGVSGTFGGVIPTPALDRIAKAGLRYTQFNSTALCSPTRAALITGRNHHSVGLTA